MENTQQEQSNYNYAPSSETHELNKLNGEDIGNLTNSARWSKFLGILMFVLVGIMALISLGVLFSGNSVLNTAIGTRGASFKGMFFIYLLFMLVLMLVYYFLGKALYNFGKKTKAAFDTNNPEELSLALKGLNSFFTISGVLSIIVLSIYGLVIIFSLLMLAFKV